jgi:hypothetical protein
MRLNVAYIFEVYSWCVTYQRPGALLETAFSYASVRAWYTATKTFETFGWRTIRLLSARPKPSNIGSHHPLSFLLHSIVAIFQKQKSKLTFSCRAVAGIQKGTPYCHMSIPFAGQLKHPSLLYSSRYRCPGSSFCTCITCILYILSARDFERCIIFQHGGSRAKCTKMLCKPKHDCGHRDVQAAHQALVECVSLFLPSLFLSLWELPSSWSTTSPRTLLTDSTHKINTTRP